MSKVNFEIYVDEDTRNKAIEYMDTFTPVQGTTGDDQWETVAVASWLADLDELDRTAVTNLASKVARTFYA